MDAVLRRPELYVRDVPSPEAQDCVENISGATAYVQLPPHEAELMRITRLVLEALGRAMAMSDDGGIYDRWADGLLGLIDEIEQGIEDEPADDSEEQQF